MEPPATTEVFTRALDSLVVQLKEDRSILALMLCGSLSHDAVWAKSDIDLVIVTVDDRKSTLTDLSLASGDVNIHALILPRAAFRQQVDGAIRQSFMHSFLSKGRLLYSHDPTIVDLLATLTHHGARDTQVQLLAAATHVVPPLYKARKFLITRGDLDYTTVWILDAAGSLARIEVISRGLLADREVLPQALALNPDFFSIVYTGLINTKKTDKAVRTALEAAERYLADRAPTLFAPIIDHLREVGDARSCTELESHFTRHFGVSGVTTACEYLADEGLIGKASTPAKVTKRSNVEVQELAFFMW